jgi:hypothetical protein
MPLSTCADCGAQISSRAMRCPSCGRPWAGAIPTQTRRVATGCFLVGCLGILAIVAYGAYLSYRR